MLAGLAQTAEVDDLLEIRSRGSGCKEPSEALILVAVFRTRHHHRMDQVIRGITADQRVVDRLRPRRVTLDDLEPRVGYPGASLELACGTNETSDAPALLEQVGDEASTDVSSGTSYENEPAVSVVRRALGH